MSLSDPIVILGQGLAGSLLGWTLERNGVPFRIVEKGGAQAAASRVGAGILNPVTGRRVVKSWGVDRFLPVARRVYREIEDTLGRQLWYPVRVRRLFQSEAEVRIVREKSASGELAPYVQEIDGEGFWIASAARVDTARLIDGLNARWRRSGHLGEGPLAASNTPARGVVIRCIGAEELRQPAFHFAHLQGAKGEILSVAGGAIPADTLLNRGHWALPLPDGTARVGATYERDFTDLQPSPANREKLEASARLLLGPSVRVIGHEVGVRVTTPDKHPVIGWHSTARSLGIFNGLGSKGALLAPALAQQWLQHLLQGTPFEPAVDVQRFAEVRPSPL